jgi:hypothetical protein
MSVNARFETLVTIEDLQADLKYFTDEENNTRILIMNKAAPTAATNPDEKAVNDALERTQLLYASTCNSRVLQLKTKIDALRRLTT